MVEIKTLLCTCIFLTAFLSFYPSKISLFYKTFYSCYVTCQMTPLFLILIHIYLHLMNFQDKAYLSVTYNFKTLKKLSTKRIMRIASVTPPGVAGGPQSALGLAWCRWSGAGLLTHRRSRHSATTNFPPRREVCKALSGTQIPTRCETRETSRERKR